MPRNRFSRFSQLAAPYAQAYALPQKQEKAHANFMRNVDVTELNRIIREALLKHFTEAELKALARWLAKAKNTIGQTIIYGLIAAVIGLAMLGIGKFGGK